MIRRPPRSTLSSSSAASDVYKRQLIHPPVRGRLPRALPKLSQKESEPVRIPSHLPQRVTDLRALHGPARRGLVAELPAVALRKGHDRVRLIQREERLGRHRAVVREASAVVGSRSIQDLEGVVEAVHPELRSRPHDTLPNETSQSSSDRNLLSPERLLSRPTSSGCIIGGEEGRGNPRKCRPPHKVLARRRRRTHSV